jgi:hypothetical protein
MSQLGHSLPNWAIRNMSVHYPIADMRADIAGRRFGPKAVVQILAHGCIARRGRLALRHQKVSGISFCLVRSNLVFPSQKGIEWNPLSRLSDEATCMKLIA